MKAYLIAGISLFTLTGNVVFAKNPPTFNHNVNANVRNVMHQVDCPAMGFVKQGATGTASGTHSFDCITRPAIHCGVNLNTAALSPTRMGTQGVQFAYGCSWTASSQQQSNMYAAQACAPGFAKSMISNQGSASTVSASNNANGNTSTTTTPATWRGYFRCTTPRIQCPSSTPAMLNPQAFTLTTPPKQAQFSYKCSYTQIN